MKTRFALIALAGMLSLPALAGPYLTPTARGVQPLFAGATAATSCTAAPSSVAASEVRFIGGEIGYVFPEGTSTLSRADFLALQARPEAAGTRDGWIAVGGQEGFRFVLQPSNLTREEVLAAAQMTPVTADGWRFVGGELGSVFVGRSDPAPQVQALAPASAEGTSAMPMAGQACGVCAAGQAGPSARARVC
jgi:hypothetical protein